MSAHVKQILVLFNIKHPFDRKIIDGIHDAMQNSNRNLQLTFMTHDEAFLVAHDHAWDAVIADFDRLQNIDLCASLNVPVVALVSNQHNVPDLKLPKLLYLALDTREICQRARDHLLACGVRHFAFFSGIADDIGYWAKERREMFEQLVIEDGSHWSGSFDTRTIRAYLENGFPEHTGFLCASDTQARQLITLAQNLNIDIPSELAIIGIDNDEVENQLSQVPISTVTVDPYVLGELAFNALLNLKQDSALETKLIPPGEVQNRLSAYLDVSDDPMITKALKFIYQNYHRPIKADQVISHCNTSRNTLENRFKKVLSKTVHQVMYEVRIESAKHMLAKTSKAIDDIALQCGLSSPQYLYYLFRKEVGMTPTQYRDLQQTETRAC